MTPSKDARKRAQRYLDAHSTYTAALKALLADLGAAREAARREEEDLLCDALIALQRLGARDDRTKD